VDTAPFRGARDACEDLIAPRTCPGVEFTACGAMCGGGTGNSNWILRVTDIFLQKFSLKSFSPGGKRNSVLRWFKGVWTENWSIYFADCQKKSKVLLLLVKPNSCWSALSRLLEINQRLFAWVGRISWPFKIPKSAVLFRYLLSLKRRWMACWRKFVFRKHQHNDRCYNWNTALR